MHYYYLSTKQMHYARTWTTTTSEKLWEFLKNYSYLLTHNHYFYLSREMANNSFTGRYYRHSFLISTLFFLLPIVGWTAERWWLSAKIKSRGASNGKYWRCPFGHLSAENKKKKYSSEEQNIWQQYREKSPTLRLSHEAGLSCGSGLSIDCRLSAVPNRCCSDTGSGGVW